MTEEEMSEDEIHELYQDMSDEVREEVFERMRELIDGVVSEHECPPPMVFNAIDDFTRHQRAQYYAVSGELKGHEETLGYEVEFEDEEE